MYPVKRTYWFDIYKVCYEFLFLTFNVELRLTCLINSFFCALSLFYALDLLYAYSSLLLICFQNIDKIPQVTCPVLIIHVSVSPTEFFLSSENSTW
jgi:hypothetical protein